MSEQPAFLDLTVGIVSAFVGKNSVRPDDLPELIAAVHASLTGLGTPAPAKEPAPELKPAVPIKKSITDEYIISLEDGRRFKSIKRYLTGLGMTPDQYRAKWGLPKDYPMVAPAYSAKRSEFAKAVGLGAMRRGVRASQAASEQPTTEDKVSRKRGRPKKIAG